MTAPERIYHWQHSQLSIARHYGGITYQGKRYAIAEHEEGRPLVRWDVMLKEKKAFAAAEREKWRKLREDMDKRQEELF